jgi:hypothetical protein
MKKEWSLGNDIYLRKEEILIPKINIRFLLLKYKPDHVFPYIPQSSSFTVDCSDFSGPGI